MPLWNTMMSAMQMMLFVPWMEWNSMVPASQLKPLMEAVMVTDVIVVDLEVMNVSAVVVVGTGLATVPTAEAEEVAVVVVEEVADVMDVAEAGPHAVAAEVVMAEAEAVAEAAEVVTAEAEAADTILVATADLALHPPERDETADPGLPLPEQQMTENPDPL